VVTTPPPVIVERPPLVTVVAPPLVIGTPFIRVGGYYPAYYGRPYYYGHYYRR
jgi:hypothetical protein